MNTPSYKDCFDYLKDLEPQFKTLIALGPERISNPSESLPESLLERFLYRQMTDSITEHYYAAAGPLAHNLIGILKSSKAHKLELLAENPALKFNAAGKEDKLIEHLRDHTPGYYYFMPGAHTGKFQADRKLVIRFPSIQKGLDAVRRLVQLLDPAAKSEPANPYAIYGFKILLNTDLHQTCLRDEKLVVYYEKGIEDLTLPSFDSNGQAILHHLKDLIPSDPSKPITKFFPFYEPSAEFPQSAAWAGIQPGKRAPGFTRLRVQAITEMIFARGRFPAEEGKFEDLLKHYFAERGINPDAPQLYQ